MSIASASDKKMLVSCDPHETRIAVLDDDLPACLYVYKGTMSAKRIAERVTELFERRGVS